MNIQTWNMSERAGCLQAMQSVIQTALLAQKHCNDLNGSQPNDHQWSQHPFICGCRPPDQCSTSPPAPLPVFAVLNLFSLISIDLQEDKVLGTVTAQLVWFRSRPNSLSAHSVLGVYLCWRFAALYASCLESLIWVAAEHRHCFYLYFKQNCD